jgi:hypothetical protein
MNNNSNDENTSNGYSKRRSNAFIMSTNKKKSISDEAGLNDQMKDEEKVDKIGEVLEKELNKGNNFYRHLDINHDNVIDIPPPKYQDFKKEYYTKNEKVK